MTAIILARSLAAPEFAAYSYYYLTVSMLATYLALGLGVTASRFFAQVGHEPPGADSVPLGTLVALSLTVPIAAFALVSLVPQQYLDAGLDVPRWLLAAGVAGLVFGVVPGGAILGLERYRAATLVSGISGFTMLGAAVVTSRLGNHVAMMAALAAIALTQAVGQYVVAGRAVGWPRMMQGFGLRRDGLRRVTDLAAPMLLVSLMAASGTWLIGRFILHGQDAEREFALYAIGLQWFSLTMLLPGMIARVVLPRMVRTAFDQPLQVRALTRRAALLATGFAVLMAIFGLVFGRLLMGAYGGNYDGGPWFIGAYMLAAVLVAPANSLGNSIVARDGQWTWLKITGVWFFVLLSSAAAGVASGLGAWTGVVALSLGGLALGLAAIRVCTKMELI